MFSGWVLVLYLCVFGWEGKVLFVFSRKGGSLVYWFSVMIFFLFDMFVSFVCFLVNFVVVVG